MLNEDSPAVPAFLSRSTLQSGLKMANRVGQRFGDYRLMRFLGQGTLGDAYVVEHIYDKTYAAVKVLKTQLTPDKLKDFINEVRIFRLKHPNIVQLLDIGISDGDIPFLVMDYAPSGSLRDRHPKGTRLAALWTIQCRYGTPPPELKFTAILAIMVV